MYSIKILTGTELSFVRSFIAQQRLAAFREYPYLYQGSLEGEHIYFDWFSKLPSTAVAVVYCGQTPVAFLAGAALTDFDEHFEGSVELFKEAGFDVRTYYYFSEVIVEPEHRGHGLSRMLFEALAEYVINLGFSKGCFVCESHENHPLKPKNYKELDVLWFRLGYTPASIVMHFNWPTTQVSGGIEDQWHTMKYWIKDF